MQGEKLREDSRERRASWAAALEPEHGAAFTIFVQNPYSDGGADRGEDLRTTIRVSRPIAGDDGRGITLEGLAPSGEISVLLADDEIAVVNYPNKPAYDWSRPYRALPNNLDQRRQLTPGSLRRLDPRLLCACLTNGTYQQIACAPLTPTGRGPSLRSVPRPIQAPPFGVAMAYATTRRALDIWKVYLNWDDRFADAIAKPFPWHFRAVQPRLEIVPFIKEARIGDGVAASGFGFIELGSGQTAEHHTVPLQDTGQKPGSALEMPVPYWLNPDVLTHELGHHLLYATLGFGPGIGAEQDGPAWTELWRNDTVADPRAPGEAFRAFHEGFSDVAAMLVALHHDTFLRSVIAETQGDIFSVNALTSIGEVTCTKTIRNAMNNLRLADVAVPDPNDPPEFGYYRLSQVISGALFDILAAFGLHYLAVYRVLQPDIVTAWEQNYPRYDPAQTGRERLVGAEGRLKKALATVYALPNGPSFIRNATVRARDALGQLLGGYLTLHSNGDFDPSGFSLAQLRDDLVAVARKQSSPSLSGLLKADVVRNCFAWRGM
jgi:hypothetical protein